MNQPELGMKVVELRLHKGMTQEQLAEAASVNVRTIQRIEKGVTEPEAFTVNNLCEILQYDFRKTGYHDFWITVLHLSTIVNIVIIPLLIWSYRKKDNSMMDRHGRDVMNFQLTMTILLFGAALLYAIMLPGMIIVKENNLINISEPVFIIITMIPVALLILFGLFCFYQGIANTLKILNNKTYRYPLSIPFLKT